MPKTDFTEFRKDGWPLCPACGEDELYSRVALHWVEGGRDMDTQPTIADCLAGEFGCYACGWETPSVNRRRLMAYALLGSLMREPLR